MNQLDAVAKGDRLEQLVRKHAHVVDRETLVVVALQKIVDAAAERLEDEKQVAAPAVLSLKVTIEAHALGLALRVRLADLLEDLGLDVAGLDVPIDGAHRLDGDHLVVLAVMALEHGAKRALASESDDLVCQRAGR